MNLIKKKLHYSLIQRMLVLVISLFASVIVFELFLRLFFWRPQFMQSLYVSPVAKKSKFVMVRQSEFNCLYEYNNYGYRDEDYDAFSCQKIVLFLGDSQTEGFGVEKQDRFSDLVEKSLGKHFHSLNLSQLATNPDTYLQNLIQVGLKYDPKLIVCGFYMGNDFMGGRNYKDTVQKSKLTQEHIPERKCRPFFLQTLFDQSLDNRRMPLICRKYTTKNYWELYFEKKINIDFYTTLLSIDKLKFLSATKKIDKQIVHSVLSGKMHCGLMTESIKHHLEIQDEKPYYTNEDYENTFLIIKKIYETAKENNMQFVLLIIPDLYEVAPHDFQANLHLNYGVNTVFSRLNELPVLKKRLALDLARNQIPFIDSTQSLKESKKMSYYLNDCHMNKNGHKIISQLILDYIYRNKLVE